jgi:hypothetical protein
VTAAACLRAIADRLRTLWPDKKVYVDEVPANIDGNMSIMSRESSIVKGLDRRRRVRYQFEVLYFLDSHDTMSYLDWSDTMLGGLEAISVDGRVVHTSELTAFELDRVMHVTVGIDASIVFVPEAGDTMDTLQLTAETGEQ